LRLSGSIFFGMNLLPVRSYFTRASCAMSERAPWPVKALDCLASSKAS
jgi:hypothetical protein